jgi:uncharacterized phage protein (TIGR01671 family)
MREIKFRGKRVDNGGWVYGDLLTKYIHHKGMTIVEGGCIYHEVDPKTVGQDTGLKDKNGKEIYEGDIVKYKDNLDPIDVHKYKGHVEYGNGSFYITNDFMSSYRWIDYEIEVKGNIHDNPELLKGDEGE